MMLNGDIKELFDIDISEYELGVVLDRYGHIFIRPKYFNAGMLLMNMQKIKETNLFERVKEMCLNKKMGFPDQTALNKCAKKNCISHADLTNKVICVMTLSFNISANESNGFHTFTLKMLNLGR